MTSEVRAGVSAAASTAVVFAAVMLLLSAGDWRVIALGSLVLGVGVGLVRYRRGVGLVPVPPLLILVAGVVGLLLATYSFLLRDRPTGNEWVAVVLVFAFMVAAVIGGLREIRRR